MQVCAMLIKKSLFHKKKLEALKCINDQKWLKGNANMKWRALLWLEIRRGDHTKVEEIHHDTFTSPHDRVAKWFLKRNIWHQGAADFNLVSSLVGWKDNILELLIKKPCWDNWSRSFLSNLIGADYLITYDICLKEMVWNLCERPLVWNLLSSIDFPTFHLDINYSFMFLKDDLRL